MVALSNTGRGWVQVSLATDCTDVLVEIKYPGTLKLKETLFIATL